MASEVRIGILVHRETGAEPRKFPIVRLLQGDEPKIVANYSEQPPQQFVITNLGQLAIVEMCELAPVDRLPVHRQTLAMLTNVEPQSKWNYEDAMHNDCQLLVRYVSGHPAC